MARTVPGTGAVIEPIFDDVFGVRAVKVVNGGTDYDPADPPRLTITGCGIPEREALLYPIIDEDSGRIIHVRVLDRGRGYDPLRLEIIPEQETPSVLTSFDVNRIWQNNPNSQTQANFQVINNDISDRLRITSDNHPKPSNHILEERQPGGSDLIVDRNFDQTFIYRGGKDVPNPGTRELYSNTPIGIMANGVLLHTPEWGTDGNPPTDYGIDAVKYPYLKQNNDYDAVIDESTYYYQNSKLINEFSLRNGVFENGRQVVATWNVKVEYDNIMLPVSDVDETLGQVQVGRIITQIGGSSRGEISKVVRNQQNIVTRIYVRSVTGDAFEDGELFLGSNGFTFTVSDDPITFPNGIFYIDFGTDAEDFGPFVPGQYYFAPENIQVPANYLIIWNQDNSSNQPSETHAFGHPMQFSTTQDGPLNSNPGTLYYNSTGLSEAPSADYENEFRPLFLMNSDESNRIYYHCKYHRHMSGYIGDEGYMTLSPVANQEEIVNNYYVENFFRGRTTITPDNLDDYNSILQGVILTSGGTGTSSNDGFNIGTHFRFNGSGSRILVFELDLRNTQTLDVEVIKGNDFNGGELPDGGSEELRIFFGGTVYGSTVLAAHEDASDGLDTLTTLRIGVPPDSRNENQLVYIYQPSNSGSIFDHWGVRNITFGGGDSDYARHPDGHSKVLGMSFDGYPIYGPYGYLDTLKTVGRMTSSYRLRTTDELPGSRPQVVEAETITYTVTVSNGEFLFDGTRPNFLNLFRGKTYIFNQNDSSNDGEQLLLSESSDGWHSGNLIGAVAYLYSAPHFATYYLDGSQVTYDNYIGGFNSATTREIRFLVPVDAPRALYAFAYSTSGLGIRLVQDGYLLGDLVEDYIYDESEGILDEYNGRFASTPEYPNGTYAYFLTEDELGNPKYPYCIAKRFYGAPLFEGDSVPSLSSQFPTGASGDIVLNDDGSISYIKMTQKGDNYFGPAQAKILGGEGSGAVGTPIVQTVTGLSLLNEGRNYQSPPTLIFEGGGGQGAQGAAEIDTLGKVSSVDVVDEGEFYQEPPFILVTGGGGIGAKAVATVDQGVITGIEVTDPGRGYTSQPSIIFTKLVNLKRKTRARQAFNSGAIFLTGLVKDVAADDSEIFVDSTDAYPGSGEIILNAETITYTAKSQGRFSGLTRGVNFNYDQRVILDAGQNDPNGISLYNFNVGDRVIRRVESANNKVAKVYDWNPSTRELLVTFEVDELAFIDGGIPSTEDAIVQFDAGLADSASSAFLPHVILTEVGSTIPLLTVPLGVLQDRAFEDDDEQDGAGDGIPDLVNTGTDYENQISLDGGIYNSLYGIEETQGGQNTTLFQVGDSIKDGSIPFKFANIVSAGQLTDGVEHTALLTIQMDPNFSNGQNYGVNEVVTGVISGVRATVVSWDPATSILVVGNIVPFNTGNINVGIAGYLYEFSQKNTIVDFVIQNPGTNYTATPTITIENLGDIQATATVNMTTAGDQVDSITITNGGYGIEQYVDGSYNIHPTVTFTNDPGDTTGSGAIAQAVMGGEYLTGNGGASYRIKSIEYQTFIRS